MEPVVSAQSVRDAEAAWFAAHPGGDLMAVAARAVADVVAEQLDAVGARRVLVVAGPGNNAGDALFAAAFVAAERRVDVLVHLVGDSTHEAGLAAAVALDAVVVDAVSALGVVRAGGVVVIDGVSGLGGRPGLAPGVAALASACRAERVPVVAVDVPSGLVADSHLGHESFSATRTVTFIAPKLAHVASPAAERCGVLTCVDIGVEPPASDVHVVTDADLAAWYPWPHAGSDKYSRGVVGLDTGSLLYPGAATLGAAGALWAGAGMVRYAGPAREQVLARFPSVVVPADASDPGRVQAWVCGSGWDADGAAARLASRVADGVPLVLDAGALEVLPGSLSDGSVLPGSLPSGSVLTPHAGELARLLGVSRDAVDADPIGHARRAASEHGVTVLLKGGTQYAVAPDGSALIALRGEAWTATAGSGDTLAGALGAMLAGGVPAQRAAALAASLQAEASRRRPGPVPPDRLAEEFGPVIHRWHSLEGS